MSNARQEKLVLLRQIEASCDTAIVGMKKLNSSLESVVEVNEEGVLAAPLPAGHVPDVPSIFI